jgi:cytochrome c551/c552
MIDGVAQCGRTLISKPDQPMHLVDIHVVGPPSVRFLALCAVVASLMGFGISARAADGARMASDHGCLNCHHSEAQAAPTLKQLADHVARDGGDGPEALQHMLREMREHTGIHSHQMVSDESALAVLKWLAQGAK